VYNINIKIIKGERNMNLTTGYTNPIFEMIGYEPKTTFWTDFSIADMFGVEGVKDTYNRAKDE